MGSEHFDDCPTEDVDGMCEYRGRKTLAVSLVDSHSARWSDLSRRRHWLATLKLSDFTEHEAQKGVLNALDLAGRKR
jgi:hypothetical protein